MSQSYSANYDGYQDWRSDENQRYESVYNNTALAESNPMLYIGELIYTLMQIYGGAPGWLGLGMDHASDDLNTLSQLQGLFSNPSSAQDPYDTINNADQMYQQANYISNPSSAGYDPSNPFFEVDQTLCAQLQAIFPPGWTFPTGSALTQSDVDEVTSYFQSEWDAAANGNTSYINATNTAFSNATSAVNGINSQMQSEEKYYNSQLQEFEGLFQNVTKGVSGVESQSVNNEIPS